MEEYEFHNMSKFRCDTDTEEHVGGREKSGSSCGVYIIDKLNPLRRRMGPGIRRAPKTRTCRTIYGKGRLIFFQPLITEGAAQALGGEVMPKRCACRPLERRDNED